MNQYDGQKGTVTSLLQYYFKTAFIKSGLKWDSDNDAEIEQLTDAIDGMIDAKIQTFNQNQHNKNK
jgi:hypothetical protein